MIEVGVVGFGKMGVLHSALINATGRARVVAIVEKDKRMVKALRRNFGNKINVLIDVNELKGLVDVIFVTTPIPTHYNVIKNAIKLGVKGVFTEKTLTDDYARSLELSNSVGNVLSAVGYQKRFIPTFARFRDLINDVGVEHLEELRAYAYSEDFLGVNDERVSTSRGGVLRDLGSHAIDLLIWLLNVNDVNDVKVLSTDYVKSEDAPCGEYKIELLIRSVKAGLSTSWCKQGYRLPEVGVDAKIRGMEYLVDDFRIIEKKGSDVRKIYRAQLNEPTKYLLASPEYFREVDEFLCSVTGECDFTGARFGDALIVDKVISDVLSNHAHTGW